jgi:hypothetical protein
MAATAPHNRNKPVESLDEWLRWAVGGCGAGLVLLLRLINGKADRTELVAYIKEATESRKEMIEKLDKVTDSTQKTALCLARLEGRIRHDGGDA